MKIDVYQEVTNRIIEQLEQGVVPWRKPWRENEAPRNLVSGHKYKGINILLLNSRGFSSPYWLSFKQAQNLGGKVKAGEKATLVVFWKMIRKKVDKEKTSDEESNEEQETNEEVIPLLRYYKIFNSEQVEGIEDKVPQPEKVNEDFNVIEEAQSVVDNMNNSPQIKHNGDKACYQLDIDTVNIPEPERFEKEEEYYSTVFHELTHSTGHPERLNRGSLQNNSGFGSKEYSREELVAEIGASFLNAETGIEQKTEKNSVAYIQNWLQALKNDKRLVVTAAGKAQKAVEYILNE